MSHGALRKSAYPRKFTDREVLYAIAELCETMRHDINSRRNDRRRSRANHQIDYQLLCDTGRMLEWIGLTIGTEELKRACGR